ncbi:hypothetical protein OA957_00320 [Prochlorococcus sp. AH-716-B04]|nr:hypothetical protein [Prochlorococcus sp. AH-716-B04]
MRKKNNSASNKQFFYKNNLLPDWVKVPSKKERKKHAIETLKKYWPFETDKRIVKSLKISHKDFIQISLPLKMIPIEMPDFAPGVGNENFFFVPSDALDFENNKNLNWEKVDWWLVIFLLLECSHERVWEYKFGSIHSYSSQLKNWDSVVWDYAWVNRIAIFIRFWALNKNIESNHEFPINGEIRITHDLDALEKTIPIIIKQSLLSFFNVLRAIFLGKYKIACNKLSLLFKFLFLKDNWNTFPEIIKKEKNLKIRPIVNIHARNNIRDPVTWLLDPSYKIKNKKVISLLNELILNNWEIGLHPGFFSFENHRMMLREKIKVENLLSIKINFVRQHWLRFSWERTWNCQAKAGLFNDSTLMFNDRSGFRNAAAISFSSFYSPKEHFSITTSYMDSHINNEVETILSEVKKVRGDTYILFHSHTLTKIYGWKSSWEKCLSLIAN